MVEQADLEALARELVFLQHQLLTQLERTFCLDGSQITLPMFPRYGVLEEPATLWGFSQHGLGVRFIDIRSLTIVDIEDGIDTPDHFTLWRLASFLRSKGETESAELLEKSDIREIRSFVTPVAGKSGVFRLQSP